VWTHLAAVDDGESDTITADEFIVNIDADAVLVAVGSDDNFLCPVSI
jgi:hypothetical protein